ncbi:MAG: protein phosphatase 2C domain-containing protein, partial [Myxococcota bacterium]
MDEKERTETPVFSRPLSADDLFTLGLEIAQLLAAHHASGQAGGLSGLWRDADGVLHLNDTPSDSSPIDDVRIAARIIGEAAVRRLPIVPAVTDEQLIAHMALMTDQVPPDLIAVLCDALGPDPHQRPADGIALWARLANAQATHQVRASAPLPFVSEWSLAHDTHIGMYKSRLGQVNQDALFYQIDRRLTLMIVADGISISTAGSGNLASALLVQVAAAAWERQKDTLQDAQPEQLDAFLVEML